MNRISQLLACTTAIAIVACAPDAVARPERRVALDLPAQDLGTSLRALSLASGRTVVADAALVSGHTAPALRGTFAIDEALARLLAGSGLTYQAVAHGYAVRAATEVPGDADASPDQIVVTGSRIRGGPIASPVIRVDRQTIRDAGQTSLADAAAAIPQSFGGGQNPGVGANASGSINVSGASTINLRGLGSDATLTLIDGHRLSYDASRQGIDVSIIPLDMVERIEIVADGASALYGSDAVAGVANVILRRDYKGLTTSADIGGATEGGYVRQQYGAISGTRWSTGGFAAAYEYAQSTAILSDQRSFAAIRPGVTIFPALRRHAVALTGHQALGDRLTFRLDVLFNKRWTRSGFPLNAAGDLSVSHGEKASTSQSFAIAPSLEYTPGGGWSIALSGTYGEDRTRLASDTYAGSTLVGSAPICYCNSGRSVELGASGPLVHLPAGAVKIAVGGGYRNNVLNADRGMGNPGNVYRSQSSRFGYGELEIPLIAPSQEIAGVRRLDFTGALRYERYPGLASVTTPKLGVVYSPAAGVTLKGSWGRSFRAPSLYEQYQATSALLYLAASLGAGGAPAGATALFIQGGNPALKPERATTWTATLELAPPGIDGLDLSASYFSTHYNDRVVTPIAYQFSSLSDPAYSAQVSRMPDPGAVAAAIAGATQYFNVSGQPYDPAKVIAIIDDRVVNAGRQRISGVDVSARYQARLGSMGDRLTLALAATYLQSHQRLTVAAPETALAGTLFHPPHWRARGSVTWSHGGLTLNGTLARIGGVDDLRGPSPVAIAGMTTLDLTARYVFQDSHGPLRGLELTFTVQNAFDAKPTSIATTQFTDSAYDSTNYSAIGRVISAGVRKSW